MRRNRERGGESCVRVEKERIGRPLLLEVLGKNISTSYDLCRYTRALDAGIRGVPEFIRRKGLVGRIARQIASEE